jgi:hypothetical protein
VIVSRGGGAKYALPARFIYKNHRGLIPAGGEQARE